MENKNTEITDLNGDCLEFIFEYLEFTDLLNIADSSKCFFNPACIVYKRKFGSKGLVFDRTPFKPYPYVIL